MKRFRALATVKQYILIICAALLVIFLVYLKTREYFLPKVVLRIGGENVIAEIAKTPLARGRGLSGHAPLKENEGMLFLFPAPGRHQFWMKGMKFPIDIVWIEAGRIIDIAPNVPISIVVPLPVYEPRLPASSALELKAGFAARHNIKIGDTVSVLTK